MTILFLDADHRRERWQALAMLAIALVVASCGAGESAETSTTTTTVPPVATTGATTTTVPPSTTTLPPATTTSTTTPASTTTTLPGEPFAGFARRGDVLAVVGVAFDDVLNVRAGPGTNYAVVATLDPLADDVTATGRARLLSRSIWYEVTVGSTTGWASSAFLAFLGATDDATAEIIAAMGEIPSAATMLDLGRIVADATASTEPRSRITVTAAPTLGDLGEVIYDVIGLGDDAVFGLRLHVFGTPGDGFSLKSVERTYLCGRGATSEGLCV